MDGPPTADGLALLPARRRLDEILGRAAAGPDLDHAEHQAERIGAAMGSQARAQPVRALPASGVQRDKLGTAFTHPPGLKTPHKKITAHFDGAQFTVFGDRKKIVQVAAQSGIGSRPRPDSRTSDPGSGSCVTGR